MGSLLTHGADVAFVIEQAGFGEVNGFDSFWIEERHGLKEALSASNVIGAAIAVRTMAMRIGVMPVMGLVNPIYIAEDIAVLDNLSNGRVIASPIPASPLEARAYGLSEEEICSRFTEALAVLRHAWMPIPFRHQGTFWKIPGNLSGNPFAEGFDQVVVSPQPAQPFIQTWTPAKMGIVPWASGICFPGYTSLAEVRELLSSGNATQEDGAIHAIFREVFVAESDADAREAIAGVAEIYSTYRRLGLLDARKDETFDDWCNQRLIVGSVSTCLDMLQKYRDAGIHYVVCRFAHPGISPEAVLHSIRLFGQGIIPEFRMSGFPEEIRIKN